MSASGRLLPLGKGSFRAEASIELDEQTISEGVPYAPKRSPIWPPVRGAPDEKHVGDLTVNVC